MKVPLFQKRGFKRIFYEVKVNQVSKNHLYDPGFIPIFHPDSITTENYIMLTKYNLEKGDVYKIFSLGAKSWI